MSSINGEKLKIAIFGESHGEAIGMVMDGLPAGEKIDLEVLQRFLARRAPGNKLATQRQEADSPRIISGLLDGHTTGAPLCAIIANQGHNSADYQQLEQALRPSHADYPAYLRYHGFNDARGGGHFSGRLTAPLCVAGGIALQILARRGIEIGAHLLSIGQVEDKRFTTVQLEADELHQPASQLLPVLDVQAGEQMAQLIEQVKAQGDSIGGSIECAAINFPAGIGNPIFEGLENALAKALFAIPGLRGIEFGSGFASSSMLGSQHNDAYCLQQGNITTSSNHHGGIIGGISTGLPIIFRVAIKPTPSIAKEQQTVNIRTMQATTLQITGRHDPCIAPRAVPVVEAATACVLLDYLLEGSNNEN